MIHAPSTRNKIGKHPLKLKPHAHYMDSDPHDSHAGRFSNRKTKVSMSLSSQMALEFQRPAKMKETCTASPIPGESLRIEAAGGSPGPWFIPAKNPPEMKMTGVSVITPSLYSSTTEHIYGSTNYLQHPRTRVDPSQAVPAPNAHLTGRSLPALPGCSENFTRVSDGPGETLELLMEEVSQGSNCINFTGANSTIPVGGRRGPGTEMMATLDALAEIRDARPSLGDDESLFDGRSIFSQSDF